MPVVPSAAAPLCGEFSYFGPAVGFVVMAVAGLEVGCGAERFRSRDRGWLSRSGETQLITAAMAATVCMT